MNRREFALTLAGVAGGLAVLPVPSAAANPSTPKPETTPGVFRSPVVHSARFDLAADGWKHTMVVEWPTEEADFLIRCFDRGDSIVVDMGGELVYGARVMGYSFDMRFL